MCLDSKNIILKGGNTANSTQLVMDVYDCQNDLKQKNCNKTLKEENILIQLRTLELARNHNPKRPFFYHNRNLFDLYPNKDLRQFWYQKVREMQFRNDRGWFTEFYKSHYNLLLESGVQNFSSPRDLANIKSNFKFHGKMIPSDFYAHFQITGSDFITRIDRSYWNMIMVTSLAGGLLMFTHFFIFMLYYFFNYYKLLKHMVLNVIIGKSSVFPERYELRDDYPYLFFTKCTKCCKKKFRNSPEYQEKKEI